MRTHNKIGDVIPHCNVCMEKLSVGEEVVLDGLLIEIIHTNCSLLPSNRIADCGKFEEVIGRNQGWFKRLNFLIKK